MAEHLISQLSHVEITTDKPEESLRFYRDLLGLEESGRDGQSVFLRGYGELFHSSIKLTEGNGKLFVHAGWRTEGPDELQCLVARLDNLGVGEGWVDGDAGHGPAYRFRGPGGHLHEVLWEVTWFEAPAELRSSRPDRAQRFYPRGAAARKLDHVTLASRDPFADRNFFVENLAFMYQEGVFAPGPANKQIVALVSSTCSSHNLGLIIDHSGGTGGIKHLAFGLDTREEILRAADVFTENGVPIEQGPAKHSVGDNLYFYVNEPSGLTIELYTEAYMFYPPDWRPFEWRISDTAPTDLVGKGPPKGGNGTEGPPGPRRKIQEVRTAGDRSRHGV